MHFRTIDCSRCRGSGELGVRSATGRGETPGPVPEDARGWRAIECPSCAGRGNFSVTIRTHQVDPPISARGFDWSAVCDDDDEGGPTGYGATEEAAITDLLVQLRDRR